jgi:hypothetical protein
MILIQLTAMKTRSIIISLALFFGVLSLYSQDPAFEVLPVPENSGFRMEGYWVWGGSVIRVGSTYHLFAARWIRNEDFPRNYRHNSEIVRATSESPAGPYEFQEVVIGERDSSFWDSNMAHNPTIHKVGDRFVLFYIGSDYTTFREGTTLLRRVGYATASSVTGPWKRSALPLIPTESNNPAILLDDSGVLMMYRDEALRIYVATADEFDGNYTVRNNNVWPAAKLEDFYLYKNNNLYHMICEDNTGGISGHVRWGVHLVSENGIDGWKRYDPVVVYDHDLDYNGGNSLHCVRRERPQLFIDKGAIRMILTGVYDGEQSWCQPVILKDPILITNE